MKSVLKFLLLTFFLIGCNATEKKEVLGQDYDLETPDRFNMPESLFEISGITFKNANSDTVYAIQDEDGKVFRLAWDVSRQVHTKFSKKGDYEDLAILKSKIYILKSNGTIYSYDLSESVYEEAEDVSELKGVLPKGEYEGMYGDEATGDLYVICKNCASDDSKNSVTGYIFNPAKDSTQASRTFSIQVDEIKAITGKVARGFRPSGIAKNPLTGEWYIISAVNKLVVITNSKWKVKKAFPLNGNIFTQPEGIAFDKAGNLYISNEGDDLFSGNVLKFKKLKR